MSKKAVLIPSASFLLLFFMVARFCSAQTPSYVTVSSPFSVDETTTVPSHTLAPGSYSIRILDSLKDRSILRIDDGKGRELATFIGLRNSDFSDPHTTGPILWASAPHRKTAAIRGFAFPNGTTLEFVYPKDEAVAIAQHNNSTVPAIDPQSEGLKVDAKLSDQDRQIVTLWLLWPTRVGPGDGTPAIEAKRFRTNPLSTQTASVAPQKPVPSPTDQQAVASVKPEEESQVWWPRTRHAVTRLPQTASNLPMILLVSLLLLGFAGGIRISRIVCG